MHVPVRYSEGRGNACTVVVLRKTGVMPTDAQNAALARRQDRGNRAIMSAGLLLILAGSLATTPSDRVTLPWEEACSVRQGP